MSTDRHLADSHLTVLLEVRHIFVQKRVWVQLLVLLKAADLCFMNFTRVATTRATLKILQASLKKALDCANGDPARFRDARLAPTLTPKSVNSVSNSKWSHDTTKLKLETINH